MMSKHIPAPISEGSPYIPVMTYTIACPMVMIIPNTAERRKGGRWGGAETVSVAPRGRPTNWIRKLSRRGPAKKPPTFLSSIEEGSVLGGVAHFNDFGTSQQLHDKA